MQIQKCTQNKRRFLPLLLLADEQENMIDRYLDRGTLYVLRDSGVQAVCVVTDEGNGVLEIKNLAVTPERQHTGYGRAMLNFIKETYKNKYSILQVGTGDSPLTLPFYEKCGFQKAFTVPDFFTRYYDHPIVEGGAQLVDMIYLQYNLKKENA